MSIALACLLAVTTLFAGWRLVRRVRFFLHVFQLETYKLDRYGSWLSEHVRAAAVRLSHLVGGGLLVAAAVGFSLADPVVVAFVLLPLWSLAFISSRRYRSDREKKPLAFTARMTRLAVATGVVAALPLVFGSVYGIGLDAPRGIFWFLTGFFVADLGAPAWVALGALLTRPVEQAIQDGFKRDARARLRDRSDLTVVGITGSYGKTSTKFILAELLRQRFNVLATPSSYNTPMGLCLVVNDKLRPEHQILVLEYGIRYPGDMDELCDIAEPDLSIVTTVGLAHLETMGSQEAIAHEKGRLVDRTKEDGTVVLNADNEYVAAMEARAPGPVWRVSVSGSGDGSPTRNVDLRAHDVQVDTEGTAFQVEDAETGTSTAFRTQLLGPHNVGNVLLALAAGKALGLRLREMAHALRRVEPVDHRLALRKDGDVTVIDDAFNANPVGARNAVEILGQMDGGRRIIVTPGMVELGERQWDENKTLGTHIARHDVDLAILVGDEQTAPIQEGLREAGYPDDRLRVFPSLFDAQDFLKTYLEPGDVVLYENDLPDQYGG